MALTRDFKETIKKRVECDPDFAKSLLHEAVDLLLDGDSATAKLILRDLINATVGFERLAEEVQNRAKVFTACFPLPAIQPWKIYRLFLPPLKKHCTSE